MHSPSLHSYSSTRKKPEKKLDLTKTSKPITKTEKIFLILAKVGLILLPFLLLACVRMVKQYKRAIILRFGRVRADSPAGPGLIWVIPFTDSVTIIDIRTQSFKLPPQQMLTRDFVTVTVDAIVDFHIYKPVHCLLNVQQQKFSTESIATATLRSILGQNTLSEILKSRELISLETKREIEKITTTWGIAIERVEIKNIVLPVDLQKAMAVEAEGTRIAKAKMIEAEGEIQSAEHLREAAQIMFNDPQTLRLRYLSAISSLAAQKSTVILPFPLDLNAQAKSS